MGYRKWVVLCSLAVLFLFQSNSNAIMSTGGSTGGGNVVSCTDPLTNIKTHRLLDYYEAETLMPELLPELGNGKTELEKVDFVLDRLEKQDPRRAKKYRDTAHEFFKNTQFIQNKVLPDINDHGYVPKEPHCIIEQLAVQNISPFPQAKKYVVREEFWKKLSLEDRAGLILHEVIYGEAMAMGQKTSRNSRYFNALMSSKKLETMSAADYQDRLERVGFTDSGKRPVVPPPWEMSATSFNASPGRAFLISLGDFIINGENEIFRFTKMGGVAWVSVSSDGRVMGTPDRQDVGLNRIYVSVDDGKQKVIVNIEITVKEIQDDKLPLAIVGTPYSVDLMEWSPIGSGVTSIRIAGPRWLQVIGKNLVGTPGAADTGVFQVQADYAYQVVRDVYETQPDGSIKVRPVTEDRSHRVTLTGSVQPQPPLGREVPAGELEAINTLLVGNSGCVGTVVGPRVIMTAAHCVASGGSTGVFKHRGVDYAVKFVRSPLYPQRDHDLALGVTAVDIAGVSPLTISGAITKGMTLNLISMALDRPLKRDTEVAVIGFSGFDAIVQHASKQPVVYFGDSGAPAFMSRKDDIVAITSKVGGTSSSASGVGGTVYLARLDLPESQTFLKDFAKQNSVDICGVTMTCP